MEVDPIITFFLGGGLMSLLEFIGKRRASHAEVKRSEVDRLCVLVDQLQEDNERLRVNLRELEERERKRDQERERRDREREQEIMALRMGILILIDQLREKGIEPRWTPGTGPLSLPDVGGT